MNNQFNEYELSFLKQVTTSFPKTPQEYLMELKEKLELNDPTYQDELEQLFQKVVLLNLNEYELLQTEIRNVEES